MRAKLYALEVHVGRSGQPLDDAPVFLFGKGTDVSKVTFPCDVNPRIAFAKTTSSGAWPFAVPITPALPPSFHGVSLCLWRKLA